MTKKPRLDKRGFFSYDSIPGLLTIPGQRYSSTVTLQKKSLHFCKDFPK